MECLKLVNVSENVTKFIQESMSTWKMEIPVCGQALEEVEIKRRMFKKNLSIEICYLYDTICLTCLEKLEKSLYY